MLELSTVINSVRGGSIYASIFFGNPRGKVTEITKTVRHFFNFFPGWRRRALTADQGSYPREVGQQEGGVRRYHIFPSHQWDHCGPLGLVLRHPREQVEVRRAAAFGDQRLRALVPLVVVVVR